MDATDLLLDLFGRIPDLTRDVVNGLSPDQLAQRPSPQANSIGWLVWHLIRVQDHYVSEYLGTEQLWASGDWAARSGLEPDPSNTGYGHTPEQVAAVRPESPDVLTGYLDAVHQRSEGYLRSLQPADLDRVVDRHWDPPVTLGVRLVSVADDSLQHIGQAAYVRGLQGA
jgi:uncharacterized damage-inducible protein DinB